MRTMMMSSALALFAFVGSAEATGKLTYLLQRRGELVSADGDRVHQGERHRSRHDQEKLR